VTWAAWANPGEAERFRAYSKDYGAKNGTKVTFQTVTGDYGSKILTQLAGNAAPDVFYINDGMMAKCQESGQLMDLTEYLARPDAAVKVADTYPGLIEWCKGAQGGIYGIPPDANPEVLWFNQKLLTEAGVTENPAQSFEAGRWDQNALTSLLEKVKATGKRAMIFEGNWFDLLSIITTFGGTAFDEDDKAVFDTDPKAQAALEWLFDQLASGNMTYGGSLPKGQGVDALFYSGQVATMGYGRWVLPNLKKLKKTVQYDIAPYPSLSGKDIAPCAIYTAAVSVNAKAKDPEAALKFMAEFVNKDGQKYRLSGGGNAVPSIEGLNEVVTEGNDPPHGQWFTPIAAAGYTVPNALARNAEVATNFPLVIDKMIKAGNETPKSFSEKLVRLLNGT
jgi:multiple sugar transport system substrate-binding protein